MLGELGARLYSLWYTTITVRLAVFLQSHASCLTSERDIYLDTVSVCSVRVRECEVIACKVERHISDAMRAHTRGYSLYIGWG